MRVTFEIPTEEILRLQHAMLTRYQEYMTTMMQTAMSAFPRQMLNGFHIDDGNSAKVQSMHK